MYGYRFGEVAQDPLPEVRHDVSLHVKVQTDTHVRRPMAVDCGCSVIGSSMPTPDPVHGPTVASGAIKRVLAKLADPDPKLLRQAKEFTRRFVEENLEPLPADTDLSVETWLANSSYPAFMREELASQPRHLPGQLPDKAYDFKSFIKEEPYPEFKYPRTIQGPTDEAKVHFGPVIAACEKVIFKHPTFIKKVPVAERADYVINRLGDYGQVAASDFSSFEVSWQRQQMEAFEFPVFEHLVKNLPNASEWMRELRKVESGKIRLLFKYVSASIHATRKSGTMNTSASNGAGNWLIHEFAAAHLGLGTLCGVFEGDDGLFKYSSGKFPTNDFYQQLGFAVKLQVHECLSQASFCGLVFDPTDRIIIADPYPALTKLGWASSKYVMAKQAKLASLVRAKAMSMASQFPRAPVFAACADWVLRSTKGIDCRWMLESRNVDFWTREKLRGLNLGGRFVVDRTPPPHATRVLMEKVFGMSVDEQLRLEAWFDARDSLEPIPLQVDNPIWAYNDDVYVREVESHVFLTQPIFPEPALRLPDAINASTGVNVLIYGPQSKRH